MRDRPGKDELHREADGERGVVEVEPGLYFVGLFFLYAGSSELLGGVGRDAAHVVDHLVAREGNRISAGAEASVGTDPVDAGDNQPG